MPSDHFLDANILVGSRINWDVQHNRATRYMVIEGIKRHTSKRVYHETIGVFQRSRRLILNYLKKFYEKFGRTSDLIHIDQNIMVFTRHFVERLEKKEQNILNSFVKQNYNEIRNVALGGEAGYGDFKNVVISTFMNAINSIDKDCLPASESSICRYDSCPSHYNIYYPEEYADLYKAINYENDVLVLLDSYFIKHNHIKNNVCFVTTDHEHILKHKPEIETVLTGVSLLHPE